MLVASPNALHTEHALTCIRAGVPVLVGLLRRRRNGRVTGRAPRAVVRGEATPLVDGRKGLRTLRTTLAIAESARTGHPIEL